MAIASAHEDWVSKDRGESGNGVRPILESENLAQPSVCVCACVSVRVNRETMDREQWSCVECGRKFSRKDNRNRPRRTHFNRVRTIFIRIYKGRKFSYVLRSLFVGGAIPIFLSALWETLFEKRYPTKAFQGMSTSCRNDGIFSNYNTVRWRFLYRKCRKWYIKFRKFVR